MPNFLQLVADDLLQRYGDSISEVTLIFPSRRAGLFFNKYLSQKISKPIWSPSIATIGGLMEQISGLTTDDSISLVTKLYNIYKKVKGSDEPFESFYFWGEVMLSDFDQVDKYLVDANQLFTNIKDIKDIEERFGELTKEQAEAINEYIGAIQGDYVSELRNNYLSVWGLLLSIYKLFKEELEQQGIAYEGMAYRKASEILANPNSSPRLPENIAFIGFNALNECEKVLLQRCKRDCKALFYWDYHPTFVDNPEYEAGYFIRKNITAFPNALNRELLIGDELEPKTIKMVAAPSTVSQTKLVPRIIDELKASGANLDLSTAIVFPKENILIPTLQAIPDDIENINITMGYPIRETPAYSLAEFLVKLQMNAQVSASGTLRFYHRDALAILNHPYIRLCAADKAADLAVSIKKSNRIYPKSTELTNHLLLADIFKHISTGKELSSYIKLICNTISKEVAKLASQNSTNHLRIDLEFLYALNKSITRLDGVISTLNFEITHKTFLQLLRKAFAQERVSFSGEPLSGLQVMGFLETRALDFENIIILSFNDDVLPGRSQPVSFITPSLRVGFGLPDYKHHDAVYAYYFYRLLSRAKRVYLVYSGKAEGLSSGEKSRFGLQLEMELASLRILWLDITYRLLRLCLFLLRRMNG